MPSIAVLNKLGDVKLTWDPTKEEEVKHARAHFEKLQQAAHIFFRIDAEGQKSDKLEIFDPSIATLICEFDPSAEIVAKPVPSGG